MKKSPYRIQLVAKPGIILNEELFEQVKGLDHKYFAGCFNQFKELDGYWWAVLFESRPIGFGGLRLLDGGKTGHLCRAAISNKHRGKGLQKKLIKLRLRKVKELRLKQAVAYTIDNPISANNLIKCGFLTYSPSRNWSKAKGSLYLRKVFEYD